MEDDYYTSGGEEYYCHSDAELAESIDGIDDGHSDADLAESIDGIDDGHPELPHKPLNCKVITKESLLAAQTEDLRRVKDLLSVREHQARTLLIHHRWDVEKLLAVYVDKGKGHLFSEAGITEDVDLNPPEPNSTVMCNICMDDVPGTDATLMDCGHCFCNNCWTEHFIVKIKEGESKRIRCMAHECNSICDEAIIRKLVSKRHPDLADKFDRYILESYIEDKKKVKWCPSVPHCGNALRVEYDESCEVECSCGFQFCFSCASEAHSPCSCLMWKLWMKRCHTDSETVNWLTVHTQPCPKCLKPVEKNGGCNLVRCVCGQAFCWLCGGATGRRHTLTTIAGHSCGRFKEDIKKKGVRAKRDRYRYMHYHKRHKAHMDSIKKESRLRETIEEKVYQLEQRGWSSKDFSWISNGIHRLFRSRRALSYSYPFAYYMFGFELFNREMKKKERKIKQHLFEDHQQQLESNIEKLSEFLEEPFGEYADEKVMETRMQVINLSVVTDNLCKKMYECIENELLGPLQFTTHTIASYQSEGLERAMNLIDGSSGQSTVNNNNKRDDPSNGVTERDQSTRSGTSNEILQYSRKRARHVLSYL